MPTWPTIPSGEGYPLVDTGTGEFVSSLVRSHLNATIAASIAPTRILSAYWAFLGDSITYGSAAASTGGFVSFVSRLSMQQIRLAVRAGHQGFRTDQLQPYIASQVVPSGAGTCCVMAGTNDAAQDVTLATYSTNMTAIVTELRAAGVSVVLCEVPPRTGKAALISQYNQWLRSYASTNGIPLVAVNGPLADLTTGGLASGYDSGDAVHPNLAGHMVIAQAIVDAASPLVPQVPSPFATSNITGGSNFFANALMLTDATADGFADSWGTTGTASPTMTLETGAGWLGNAQRFQFGANSDYLRFGQTFNSGFSDGDLIGVGAIVKQVNGGANTSGFKIDVVYGGAGGTVSLISSLTGDMDTVGIWETFTIPAGATSFNPRFVMQHSGATLDVYIAQATCLNLTELGLV